MHITKIITGLPHTLKFVANHPLNNQRKASALFGFLKWQIVGRLVPGQVVYNWINGSRFIAGPGESGINANIYCGLQEFSDMAYVLHTMSEEDLFVDIGANVGSYTILACVAKGARGICFEPVPTTYQRLLDNIRLNDVSSHVKAFNIGLSDKEGELTFTASENSMNHVAADSERATDVVKVKVLSLDKILDGESPSMLKIDVEGFETPVIRGAHETLNNKSLHSVIMELNGSGSRYGFSENTILNTMKDYGFSTYTYEPFSRELKSLEGKNNLSENTLFIRNIEAVKKKSRRRKK